MTSASRHRLQLAVYVILAAVVVLALFGYARHNNQRFDKADHVSCMNRKVLLQNQRLVLRFLHQHADAGDIDRRTGKPWYVEFAQRIPSTALPNCK